MDWREGWEGGGGGGGVKEAENPAELTVEVASWSQAKPSLSYGL